MQGFKKKADFQQFPVANKMILIPSLSAISLAHEKGSCLGFTQQSLYQAQLPTSLLHYMYQQLTMKLSC